MYTAALDVEASLRSAALQVMAVVFRQGIVNPMNVSGCSVATWRLIQCVACDTTGLPEH